MNPEQNQNVNKTSEAKEVVKPERVPIKSLRTFQGDVQEAIEKNKYSSTTILVTEQKRKLERPEIADLQKKSSIKNNTYILFGSLFIILGIVSFVGLYYLRPTNEVGVDKKQKTIITYSEEMEIESTNTDRGTIIKNIDENKESWDSIVNSVLYLNFKSGDNLESVENILSIFGPNMPPSLTRSFGEEYMAGIYSFDTNEFFVILTIEDYSLAYSGMLKWEKDISKDMGELFNIELNNGTTTDNTFVDEAVKNRDMRVLKDNNGNPKITYSFIDRKTLVITKSEGILSAIAGKITLNKQVK